MKFHFTFNLIKSEENSQLDEFEWDINSDPHHRLYLSKDTTRLMEVINNFVATVYYRINKTDNKNVDEPDKEDCGQQVKWKVEFRMNRFPTSLMKHTSVPYIFSPNFHYQLDFIYDTRQFVIRETSTQFIYMYIKRDLISTDWLQIKGEQAIKIICSRFKWESENRLRFVNASNLDCIFEIRTTDPKDEDINARYLELVSAVKIDNEHKNFYRLDSNHLLD